MYFDLDELISQVLNYRALLSEAVLKSLCVKCKEVLIDEGNIKNVSSPVTLVGDVHGQFYDLLEIFKIGGLAPDTNYIFLGDYVDRGYYSVETITLLTLLKLRYPNRVTLVRGNHESRSVTQTYGFYTECVRKYGSPTVWSLFTDLFDFLVLAVVIDDCILCVHGGLSPSIHTMDQIKIIDRFREIPHEGPMADLVWSDPSSSNVPFMSAAVTPQSNKSSTTFFYDLSTTEKGDFAVSPRGAGYVFGKEVTKKFLQINALHHICRAHQLCMEGYQILYDDMLSTVWSAPNYCYRCGNLASILELNSSLTRHFNVFGSCPESERDSINSASGLFPSTSSTSGISGFFGTTPVPSKGVEAGKFGSLSNLRGQSLKPLRSPYLSEDEEQDEVSSWKQTHSNKSRPRGRKFCAH